MITITLQQDEPKVLYLALLYHLARPGSEIDPETGTIDLLNFVCVDLCDKQTNY